MARYWSIFGISALHTILVDGHGIGQLGRENDQRGTPNLLSRQSRSIKVIEFFSIWLYPPKNGPNDYPKLLLFMFRVLRSKSSGYLAHIFGW